MAEPRIGVAILAAGASRRFGDADKLAAPFRGKVLGQHVCDTIPTEPFAARWVVTAHTGHPCEPDWRAHGYGVVINESAQEGMGTSVARAAQLAREAKCSALMIALADMPLVPREHFEKLARRIAEIGASGIVVSAKRQRRMPPAAFGSDHFPALEALTGDQGARDLLHQGDIIPCPPEWLADIDTPEDLSRLA